MSHDTSDTDSDEVEYENPLKAVEGMETVTIACGVGVNDRVDECDGWESQVELDEPATFEDGKIYLPGFYWECPECGNPHEFEVEGIRVSNLV